MIRVLLVDDHAMVRAGLRHVLEEAPDVRVVAEAANGLEAMRAFERERPDLVILDISMPVMDGMDATKQLISFYPDVRILMLTMYPEEQYGVRLLRAGALGYVTKDNSVPELHDAVRTVASGQQYLSHQAKDTIILQLLTSKSNLAPVESLSDRELQVLCLLAHGKKLREVATDLNLSVNTIETYRSRILLKLHLQNNTDIVRFAIANRLIEG